MTTSYTTRTIPTTSYTTRPSIGNAGGLLLINAVDRLLINATDHLIISIATSGTQYTTRIIP